MNSRGGQKCPTPAPPWSPFPSVPWPWEEQVQPHQVTPRCLSRGIWAGQGGQGVHGGAVWARGAWFRGGHGEGEKAAGGREEFSLCPCAVSGSLVAQCPHSPAARTLHCFSLLSCRVVEASTLQQERLQAIAVSPLCSAGARRARWTLSWHPYLPAPSLAARGADASGEESAGAAAVLALGLCSHFPSCCLWPGKLLRGCRQGHEPESLRGCPPGRGSLAAKHRLAGACARASCPAAALPRDRPQLGCRIRQGLAALLKQGQSEQWAAGRFN